MGAGRILEDAWHAGHVLPVASPDNALTSEWAVSGKALTSGWDVARPDGGMETITSWAGSGVAAAGGWAEGSVGSYRTLKRWWGCRWRREAAVEPAAWQDAGRLSRAPAQLLPGVQSLLRPPAQPLRGPGQRFYLRRSRFIHTKNIFNMIVPESMIYQSVVSFCLLGGSFYPTINITNCTQVYNLTHIRNQQKWSWLAQQHELLCSC